MFGNLAAQIQPNNHVRLVHDIQRCLLSAVVVINKTNTNVAGLYLQRIFFYN